MYASRSCHCLDPSARGAPLDKGLQPIGGARGPPALPGGITVLLALTTRLFSPSPSSLVQVHSHSGAGERGGLVSPGQSAVGAHPHLPGEKPAGLRGRKQLVAERDQHGRASRVHRVSGQRVWECQAGGARLSRLGKGLQLLSDEADGAFLSLFFPLLPLS